jgi:K+-transporting ATPase ATPase C chain
MFPEPRQPSQLFLNMPGRIRIERIVQERLDALTKLEGVAARQVPSEMVTASGGGMDPHVPPAAAELQIARVAASRKADAARVRALVIAHTEAPTWGLLGRARVNVLELNLALDEAFGAPAVAEEKNNAR